MPTEDTKPMQTRTQNAGHGFRFRAWGSWLSVLWIAVVALFGPPPAMGASALSASTNQAAADQAAAAAIKPLEERLADARAQLAAFADAGLAQAPAGVAAQDLGIRRALLDRLIRLYEQQISDAAELEAVRSRKAELIREAQSWSRFSEPRPYSILFADRIREELQAERLKLRRAEAAVAMLDKFVEENRTSLAQAEERIRRFNEQLEDNLEGAASALLSWQRDQEHLRSQVAASTVAVLDLERLLHQEHLAASRVHLGLLERQVPIANAGTAFTQADVDQATNQIERERGQLERELAEAQARRRAALQAYESARGELRQAQERTETPAEALARAEELVSLRQAQLEAVDSSARVLRLMLEGTNIELAMWQYRFAAYDSRRVADLRDSARRIEAFTRRLDLWQDHVQQQLEVVSSQLQFQQARLHTLAAESELVPLVHERLDALRETDRLLLRFVRGMERLQRLAQRWDEGLRAAQEKLPFTGRVQNLFSGAGSFLGRLWTFELFTAEDTIIVDGQKISGKRSVTIGKIVKAVFILVGGIWFIGRVTRFAEPIIVRRLKIEANQAGLIRRWLWALMVACLVVFSLVSVKIPLTVFAFAGGALAIGLGFGMQTLLKNFVSGLILLFERPFRVGDVLDVAGQRGTVTSVGLRASILQLWDGTETLIPNSSLLENNVTNWTYSDRKVRFTVAVGVAYGSDARRVIQLLHQEAERHGLVEKEPKPQVLFTDFGDSTLAFELRFWVDVGKANAAQICSDLRLMIAGVFADNGIVIAFPQRDLHLHTARPLPVQMVPPTENPATQPRTPEDAG